MKKNKLKVKMEQPIVDDFDPNMKGGSIEPDLEDSFKPNVAKAPPLPKEEPPAAPQGTDFIPEPIDLSGFGKKTEEMGGRNPFEAAEVSVMEMDQPRPGQAPAPEPLPQQPQPRQAAEPMSAPPMVQAERQPSVAEFIQSKLQRPDMGSDTSGWEAAQSAANAAIGFNPGKSVYALERERNAEQQRQFESDRNAEQQLIMQSIQHKFQGGENAQNRDLEREKFVANLTSEEKRALAESLARAEQARMLEEGRNARAEEARKQRDALFQASEEGRNQRFGEGQMGADRRNFATNQTQRAIADARAVDQGNTSLGKNIDAATIKESEAVAAKINGPDGQRLLSGVAGVLAPAAGVPVVNRLALSPQQRQFAAEYKQSMLKMKHDLLGASQSQQEIASVNQAYDMGISGDPAVAAQAYNRLLKMYQDKARQTAASVRPEAVRQFQERGGYIPPSLPEDEDLE